MSKKMSTPQDGNNIAIERLKELCSFEKDLSTKLQRVAQLVETREIEIAQSLVEMQQRAAAFQGECKALAKQVEDAEQQSNKTEEENRNLVNDIATLEVQNAEQKRSIEQLQTDIAATEAENVKLKERVVALEALEAKQRQIVEQLTNDAADLKEKIAEKERLADEMEQEISQLADRAEKAEQQVTDLEEKNRQLSSRLVALQKQTDEHRRRAEQLEVENASLQQQIQRTNNAEARERVFFTTTMSILASDNSQYDVGSPSSSISTTFSVPEESQGLTCTPEYFQQVILSYQTRLLELRQTVETLNISNIDDPSFGQATRALKVQVDGNHRVMWALSGIPSNSDSEQYGMLQDKAKILQEKSIEVNQTVGKALSSGVENDRQLALGALEACEEALNDLLQLVQQLIPKTSDINPEDLATMQKREMDQMLAAIHDIIEKFEQLQLNASMLPEGQKPAIDLAICADLARAVERVVVAANKLQAEIEKSEKGLLSPKEFYRRNATWARGLISAAQEVSTAATEFAKAAEEALRENIDVKSFNGYLENVIAWAGKLSANVVSLLTASRAKAHHNSQALHDVQSGTTDVRQRASDVVLQIRQGMEDRKAQERLQKHNNYVAKVDGLNSVRRKKEEMDILAEIKRLEAELEYTHRKLRVLRKDEQPPKNYHLKSHQVSSSSIGMMDSTLMGYKPT